MTDALSDQEVQGLIRIANGGRHNPAVYGRVHWYSLFKTCLESEKWECGLEEQLIAIEQLGLSGNPRAIEPLSRFLFEVRTDAASEYDGWEDYDSGLWCYTSYVSCNFPNANGELKNALHYTITSRKEEYIPQGKAYEILINAYKKISGKRTRVRFALSGPRTEEEERCHGCSGYQFWDNGWVKSFLKDFPNVTVNDNALWGYVGSGVHIETPGAAQYVTFEVWVTDTKDLYAFEEHVKPGGLKFGGLRHYTYDCPQYHTDFDLFVPIKDKYSEGFQKWFTHGFPGRKR